eukprot:747415-Hanusia_phi.AAC.4
MEWGNVWIETLEPGDRLGLPVTRMRAEDHLLQGLQLKGSVPSDSYDGDAYNILQVISSKNRAIATSSCEFWISPAKTNIFLRITKKRDDGFHELASVFQALSLGDTMKVSILEVPQLLACT